MDPIWELGIPVIEDAAHAAESAYRGRKLGGLSEATCFSLYATKNIAAGEGGLVSTNSDEVADAIRNLRLMRRGDGSLYDITVPGYKANLSDVLAAIALVQLDKLAEHTAARERQFALYDEGIADLDGIEPLERDPRDTHALTSTSSTRPCRPLRQTRSQPSGSCGIGQDGSGRQPSQPVGKGHSSRTRSASARTASASRSPGAAACSSSSSSFQR